ncbi:hypothetical protein Tco_1119403 [Tanacetum coccineum]
MDIENLFDTQDYYAGQGSGHNNQDYYAVQVLGHGNQDYYQTQDFSMAHGSAHGSTPVEDDSPVEEVALVKAKKVSKRASKAKAKDNKETSKPWTTRKRSRCAKHCAMYLLNNRPIGDDRAKKKASSSHRSESSSVVGGGLVELVADKWKSIKSASWGKKKEQQDSYIQLNNQELDLKDVTRYEAAELKREELALQGQTLELDVKKKMGQRYILL